jgi:hypothetical protein
MRLVILLIASFSVHAAEPWQSVLILEERENVSELLASCEFKGTIAASGQASRITQRIAEEALKLGANTVHIAGTVNTSNFTGVRRATNGRAFLCVRAKP